MLLTKLELEGNNSNAPQQSRVNMAYSKWLRIPKSLEENSIWFPTDRNSIWVDANVGYPDRVITHCMLVVSYINVPLNSHTLENVKFFEETKLWGRVVVNGLSEVWDKKKENMKAIKAKVLTAICSAVNSRMRIVKFTIDFL